MRVDIGTLRLILVIVVAVAVLYALDKYKSSEENAGTSVNNERLESWNGEDHFNLHRQSVTFILGEDEVGGNQYYTEAANFYRFNEEHRAEILVTHCRSLLEVRNFLEENKTDVRPWGQVNLVVHSNEWEDMGVAVVPDGPRTSVATLSISVDSGLFLPVANNVLDNYSELMIYGCGLGNNERILSAIRDAFGGEDDVKPQVRSSKYFVYYTSEKHNGMPFNCKRYFADFWHSSYPSYYYPGDYIIARNLQNDNPQTKVDWNAALSRDKPRFPGDEFHMEFKIPLVWYVTYEDHTQRPILETDSAKLAWINEQDDIAMAAEQFNFSIDDFRWVVHKDVYEYEDGYREPALKAIGLCSIVCVLKPFIDEDEQGISQPLEPNKNDKKFFGIANDQARLVAVK